MDEMDTDFDGIFNIIDNDDDCDGILDENDVYPLDTDNDGINNEVDSDDDGDGIHDDIDLFLLDTDNDEIQNDLDSDDDNDNIDDTIDSSLLDTDNDGEKNDVDLDDDGDGLSDIEEGRIGTDQLNKDTDGDGRDDKVDVYPLDKSRWDDGSDLLGFILIICTICAVAMVLIFFAFQKRKGNTEIGMSFQEETEFRVDSADHDMEFEIAESKEFPPFPPPPPPFPPPPPPPLD
jgi:hypothetical protein